MTETAALCANSQASNFSHRYSILLGCGFGAAMDPDVDSANDAAG